MKATANEIFGIFQNYNSGKCSYDKALEDASKIIEKHANEKPIVGYVQSGTLKKTLAEIINTKKVNGEKNYMYDFKLHQNEIDTIQRMYDSI